MMIKFWARNKSQILDASLNDAFSGAPSFSLLNRLTRLVWRVTWLLFARWTPPPFRRWRVLLLRIFGANVHKTCNVYASVDVWYPPNLTMAEYSALGPGVICYCMDSISIGARTVVSQRAHLCGGSHSIKKRNFQLIAKPIVIGANAWVAAEAFVGPGVTIGDGAVLGARAVAMKNIEADAVYIGNPASFLRRRVLDV